MEENFTINEILSAVDEIQNKKDVKKKACFHTLSQLLLQIKWFFTLFTLLI